jgi:hypothetical protein
VLEGQYALCAFPSVKNVFEFICAQRIALPAAVSSVIGAEKPQTASAMFGPYPFAAFEGGAKQGSKVLTASVTTTSSTFGHLAQEAARELLGSQIPQGRLTVFSIPVEIPEGVEPTTEHCMNAVSGKAIGKSTLLSGLPASPDRWFLVVNDGHQSVPVSPAHALLTGAAAPLASRRPIARHEALSEPFSLLTLSSEQYENLARRRLLSLLPSKLGLTILSTDLFPHRCHNTAATAAAFSHGSRGEDAVGECCNCDCEARCKVSADAAVPQGLRDGHDNDLVLVVYPGAGDGQLTYRRPSASESNSAAGGGRRVTFATDTSVVAAAAAATAGAGAGGDAVVVGADREFMALFEITQEERWATRGEASSYLLPRLEARLQLTLDRARDAAGEGCPDLSVLDAVAVVGVFSPDSCKEAVLAEVKEDSAYVLLYAMMKASRFIWVRQELEDKAPRPAYR